MQPCKTQRCICASKNKKCSKTNAVLEHKHTIVDDQQSRRWSQDLKDLGCIVISQINRSTLYYMTSEAATLSCQMGLYQKRGVMTTTDSVTFKITFFFDKVSLLRLHVKW